MLNVLAVASYIANRYKATYHTEIDQMKLHKLLYFTQREAIILTGAPMFEDCFEARQYGPVMASVRYQFMNSQLNEQLSDDALNSYKSVFDSVFDLYANKSSWDLSMLSHSEQSWINARNRMKPNADCEELMLTEDIIKDAMLVKERREVYDRFHAQD